MNGRDDTTTFLLVDSRIGGQNRDCPMVGQYLTRDQTKYIYKKLETGEMINTDTIQQEIEQEKQLGRIDDTSRETNPCKELIVNKILYVKIILHEMQITPHHTKVHINHTKNTSWNGQCVSVLFIIPVNVDIHGHRFKIYTLVSEIHENVDLLLGIKNVFELEGVINSRECYLKFLNRSVPIYPKKEIILKPNEQKQVKVKAPFMDEISGLAIIKIIDGGTYSTLLIKLKFTCNKAILDIKNKGEDTMILRPEEMIGIIDMRSLGYYKIKQGILQQNLSKYYRFEKTEKLCEYFNNFVNTLKREREQKSLTDKYPWLDPDDERKHMTDREILEKYINLNNSCLDKEEKRKVMDMLFKYREAFSLRDEIGTCPNIEVEIDVTDKSPFFIRPYHVREEDKAFIDKEMKRLCYMGILKEGFSGYSSPVMLISRKLTKDKRVVTDFGHLNVMIAKNNLAYPLVKDTFSVLGNSKCKVLSVLDLKDAFHSLQLSESSKRYCGIFPYFSSSSYLYQRMPMGLNISPFI